VTVLNALWYLSVVANAAVAVRLGASGLMRRYPAFSACVIASLARSLYLIAFAPDPFSSAYGDRWLMTQPVLCVLQILMCVEIYRRVQEHYPGLGRIGAQVLLLAFLISAGVCAITLPTKPEWSQPARDLMLIALRCQSFILSGLLLMTIAFYYWWWTPKRPNVARHAVIAAALFTVQALYYQGLLTHPESYRALSCTALAATSLCYALWTALLARGGEKLPKLEPIDPDRARRIYQEWEAVIETARLLNR
jgi:Na+/melibiose symporter-like transporter